MSGRPDRSGRPRDAAALRRRNDAIAAGVIRSVEARDRAERRRARRVPALTPEQVAAANRVAGGRLGPPRSWREAQQRQMVALSAIRRERLQLELDEMKRNLVPMADVREFIALVHAAIMREAAPVVDLAQTIPDGRPHQVAAFRAALAQWVEGFRRQLGAVDL